MQRSKTHLKKQSYLNFTLGYYSSASLVVVVFSILTELDHILVLQQKLPGCCFLSPFLFTISLIHLRFKWAGCDDAQQHLWAFPDTGNPLKEWSKACLFVTQMPREPEKENLGHRLWFLFLSLLFLKCASLAEWKPRLRFIHFSVFTSLSRFKS